MAAACNLLTTPLVGTSGVASGSTASPLTFSFFFHSLYVSKTAFGPPFNKNWDPYAYERRQVREQTAYRVTSLRKLLQFCPPQQENCHMHYHVQVLDYLKGIHWLSLGCLGLYCVSNNPCH